MVKIKENQEFIDSIYKRMGLEPLPPVYSIALSLQAEPQNAEQQ